MRIAILTLDSLFSAVGIHEFVSQHAHEVVLLGASRRFGGKSGSFVKQLCHNLRRTGWRFTVYNGLHLVVFYPLLWLTDVVNRFLGRPKAVYSVEQVSRKYKIPLVHISDINSRDFVEKLRSLELDLIVLAYFDQIAKSSVIETVPPGRLLNVHPGLLPARRGPFPTFWALVKGDATIGATIHAVVDERIDVGPILCREEIPVPREMSLVEMDCLVFRHAARLLSRVVENVRTEQATFEPQTGGGYDTYPTPADVSLFRRRGNRLWNFRKYLSQFTRPAESTDGISDLP